MKRTNLRAARKAFHDFCYEPSKESGSCLCGSLDEYSHLNLSPQTVRHHSNLQQLVYRKT